MGRPGPAVLVAVLALSVIATGCAGEDPESDRDSSTSASSSPSETSSSSAASTSEAGRLIEVQAGVGGQVLGDTGRVVVPLGETVHLVVDSIAPDEVHVHGYDLTSPVSPFSPADFTFEASIPGVFAVELHDVGTLLLTLQVE